MAAAFGRLVAIDVRPGSAADSQSGLNLLKPTIYGRLAAEGCGKDLAFVVIHPSSNFFGHYLLAPLERRGRAILALKALLPDRSLDAIWSQGIEVPLKEAERELGEINPKSSSDVNGVR